jgi:hypothetical protein
MHEPQQRHQVVGCVLNPISFANGGCGEQRLHESSGDHESLRSTPAVAQGITDHVWSIGERLDAALAPQPIDPVVTAPARRRAFRVIEGGRK